MFLRAWYLLGPLVKFVDGKVVEYEIAQVSLSASLTVAADGKQNVKVFSNSDVWTI